LAGKNILVLAATLSGLRLVETPAEAQRFSTKDMTIVCSSKPRAPIDVFARQMASRPGKMLGKPVVRFLGRQWITILLFIFARGYMLAALEYGIQVRPQPQSGFVPFLLGALMIGLTGFVLARAALREKAP
jgi:hypothetical protein